VTDEAARLRDRLPRTWSPFFARYGNFRPAQLAAIPLILDGKNVVLSAMTAGGKTSAALAPLVERHLPPGAAGLHIVYVSPTKALTADLIRRISVPLDAMSIRYAVKTGDGDSLSRSNPAPLIVTTPESLDSLLASQARLLVNVRAVVLDELHLLDGTVRGDQLRAVLHRLRAVRRYAVQLGDASDDAIQYVALSATLTDPARRAARYFPEPHPVTLAGSRPIRANLLPMEEGAEAQTLLRYFEEFRAKNWRKALVFCNSRAEVERYAAAVRMRSPFGGAVYVHYSNLTAERRKAVETAFAGGSAALCFASSTLELGIDIGDIDCVIQIGAPGSAASFMQRIGRGGRRKSEAHTALFYRNNYEQQLLQAYLSGNSGHTPTPIRPFLPSVAVQQIFSMIKQSPDASVRLNPLADVFEGLLSLRDLTAIVGHLNALHYLREVRPGTFGVGVELNKLIDQQFNPYAKARYRRSLYSNIQSGSGQQIAILEEGTGQTVAHVDLEWLDAPNLILEGHSIQLKWVDKDVERRIQKRNTGQAKPFRAARQLLSYETAQLLKQSLGFAPDAAPLIRVEDGVMLFHFLGDLYAAALAALHGSDGWLQNAERAGLWLWLPANQPLQATDAQIRHLLTNRYERWEALLNPGIYQDLLPPELRERSVIDQFDIGAFQRACNLHIVNVPPEAASALLALLE